MSRPANCRLCQHLEGTYHDINIVVRWRCAALDRLIYRTHEVYENEAGEMIARSPVPPKDCPGYTPRAEAHANGAVTPMGGR